MTHSATENPRALTLKNPWAWAAIYGGKDIENRTRPTKYRGRLYIHAGQSWSSEGRDFMKQHRTPYGFQAFPLDEWQRFDLMGMVIGTVDVVDCHHCDDCPGPDYAANGMCSVWAMPNHYHWVLANQRPLGSPFPAQGKLGIWKLPTL